MLGRSVNFAPVRAASRSLVHRRGAIALEKDFEPEMTPEWFPAWMLLEEPGLAAALAPRRTDDDPSRAFDATMSLLAHPSLDGHGIELRRALQAIHPSLLERFLAKRTRTTALCRYWGRKRDRATSRRQLFARIRRSSTSSRPLRRPKLELPPLLRSELPCLDANRVRFDDGLKH